MTTRAQHAQIDIIRAIKDPRLIGDVLSPAQEAALRSLYGLPLDRDQSALAARCTGRAPEMREYREGLFVCGRRSGKSDKLCANIVIFEALFRPHRLSPGEQGIALLLAQNMRQAQVVAGFVRGKLEKSPILRQHIVSTRALEIDLDCGITIAIHPASFRAIRGLSVVCAILDEAAFWWTESESANPDIEVVRAIRPAMATHENAKLVIASSPYAKTGLVWEMWNRRHEDPETLVWHAPTALMNPTVKPAFLAREKARDPEIYAREYEAIFTDAVSAFIPSDAIASCVARGRVEIPPASREDYRISIDAAYRGDRFTLSVVHRDEASDKVVVDLLRGWEGTPQRPVQLSVILPQIREIANRYGVDVISADQFGAEPLKHAFAGVGLEFREMTFSLQSKANLFANLRSLIVNGGIELLDHGESIKELRGLEVELLPGGQSRVGHPRRHGAHDDFATAIALAAFELVNAPQFGTW